MKNNLEMGILSSYVSFCKSDAASDETYGWLPAGGGEGRERGREGEGEAPPQPSPSDLCLLLPSPPQLCRAARCLSVGQEVAVVEALEVMAAAAAAVGAAAAGALVAVAL